MSLPRKGAYKRKNNHKTLSSQTITKWFTPPGRSKSEASPQWKPTSVPLGKGDSRKQKIQLKSAINLEKIIFMKENDVEVSKEKEIINLLDDEDVAPVTKLKDRFSMDSQMTQKNSLIFASPNNSNAIQAQPTCKRIRVDESPQKEDHRHTMIQSSFGFAQLKPIPPESFSDSSIAATFQVNKLNPTNAPIPLCKNYILGRSSALPSDKFSRKRKRAEVNKVDIGIPVSAKGISRKQIKICDIFIGRNDEESHVTFQVMECVKNDFFVVIRKKWVKPEIGGKFILRFGDCILFDIYEWLENRPAQYVFQLVRCNSNNLCSDATSINVEENKCTTNDIERMFKQENNAIEQVGMSLTDPTGPTKKLTKSFTNSFTDNCCSLEQNKKNEGNNPNQLFVQNQENNRNKIADKSLVIATQANLSSNSNPRSSMNSCIDTNTENVQVATKLNPVVADRNKEKMKPFQDLRPNTVNLAIRTETGAAKNINETLKITSKSNPDVALHNQKLNKPLSSLVPNEVSLLALNKDVSLIKPDVKEEPVEIKDNIDAAETCMKSEMREIASIEYSTSQQSDTDHIKNIFHSNDELLVTEYVYNSLMNLQLYYSPSDGNVGLECVHCCNSEVSAKCKFRIFPSSSRVLKSLIKKLHNHLEVCKKIPKTDLLKLNRLKSSWLQQYTKVKVSDEDEFYDNVWERMQKAKLLLKNKLDDKQDYSRNEDVKNANISSGPNLNKKVDDKRNIMGKSSTICVGDRVAVEYEGFDIFGVPKKKRKQWYFGNVFEIKARGPVPKLNVEYDDKVQQLITYSSEDVVKLQEASDGSMHAINGSTHGQYIGYSPPKNLCIGDLVDVRTLNREKWYRGRVAKVNQKQNTCSVAYDDEDYEVNIPIDFQNVRLVTRAWKCCKWLENLSFRMPYRQSKIWKILPQCDDLTNPKSPQDVNIKVTSGRQSQTLRFEDLMEKMFIPLHKKAKVENRIRKWRLERFISELPKKKLGIVDTKQTNCAKKQEEKTYNEYEMSTLDEDESKNLVTPGPSPVRDEDDTHQSVTNTDTSSTNESKNKNAIRTRDTCEMLVSQSNSFWRALSSTEPCVGYRILRHAATIQRLIPNKYLLKNLSDSLIYGLKSEGVKLIDSNKSELTSRFTSFLIKQYSGVRMENDIKYNMSYLTWDDIKFSLAWALNLNSSTMNDANTGILEAVYAAEFISSLLKKDKDDILQTGKNELECLRVFEEKEKHRTILQLFNCSGGVREALKYTVKCTAKSWFRYGDSVLLSDSFKNNTSPAASRYLNAQGMIVSVVAWLFCVKEQINVEDKKCLFLIRDTFHNEMNLMQTEKKRRQDYSVPFILSLHDQQNEKFSLALASMFDVKEKVSTILNI